jgi:hypothetical protein
MHVVVSLINRSSKKKKKIKIVVLIARDSPK